MALAEGFEEDYAGGYADVEGFYGAGGGQRHEEVAALAGPSLLSPERKRHAMPCPERALLAGYKHGDGGVRASFLDLPQHRPHSLFLISDNLRSTPSVSFTHFTSTFTRIQGCMQH